MLLPTAVLLAASGALTGVAAAPARRATSDAAAAPPAFVPLSACVPLGFDPATLACGTCAAISRALGAAHATTSACKSCCSAALDLLDGGFSAPRRKFDGAEVVLCRARPSGGLNEWLEKSEAAWAAKGVGVTDSCAEPSAIVLSRDGAEDAAVRVSVGSWRHEDVSAFLEESLRA